MYAGMKSRSGRDPGQGREQGSRAELTSGVESPRSGRARGVYAFFALALLPLPFFGLAPDAAAQELNISIQDSAVNEGDYIDSYCKVTVTASEAPGFTDQGSPVYYRFVYNLSGSATLGEDYKFDGSTTGNNIQGTETSHEAEITVKADQKKGEGDETVTIKITRNDVHNTTLERFPSSLAIGSANSVTLTIRDDDDGDPQNSGTSCRSASSVGGS